MKLTTKLSDNTTDFIKRALPHKSEQDLEIIKYGLEIFFMTIYKIIIIILLAIYLDVLDIVIYMFFLFGIIRTFASGAHARNWITCTLSSIAVFIALPIIFRNVTFNVEIKTLIFVISFFLLYRYSPADTINRPIKNIKKRRILRLSSLILCVIYYVVSLFLNNNTLSTLIIVSLLTASMMTTPVIYTVLKNSYSKAT